MKKIIVIILVVNVFQLKAQRLSELVLRIIPNSNIVLKMPKVFEETDNDELISGFIDLSDSTQIFGAQMTLEMGFSEAVSRQLKSLEFMGYTVENIKEITHQGMSGRLIEYGFPESDYGGLILMFGKENYQNSINSAFPKERQLEIRQILLSAKIDEEIIIDKENTLGFSAKIRSGQLEKIKSNSLMIKYEYRNKSGVLQTDLGIAKIPKANFERVEITDCIDFLAEKHFPNQSIIASKQVLLMNKFSGYSRIYKGLNSSGQQQYNFIAFLRLNDFDLWLIGSANHQKNIYWMEDIMESIQLE